MKKLNLPDSFYSDIIDNGFERSKGWEITFVYQLEGVSFEFSMNDKLSTDEEKMFTTVFSKIRLDISGKGLQFLRQFLDVDVVFCSPAFFGEPTSFNVTRVDFAFDFVNYKGDFPYLLIDYLHSLRRDQRLHVGKFRAIKYDYHKSTAYLGKGGDKMLRVYDKKEEQSAHGIFKGSVNEFEESDRIVDTWFRIELQTRRKCACDCLFTCDCDLTNVLRFIFDNYKIYDENGEVLPFILDLYDWDKINSIVGKYDFIQLAPVLQRCEDYT